MSRGFKIVDGKKYLRIEVSTSGCKGCAGEYDGELCGKLEEGVSRDSCCHEYIFKEDKSYVRPKEETPKEPSKAPVSDNKPHPHRDLIIAWVNGAKIEYRHKDACAWFDAHIPYWSPDIEYRLKPTKKPDVVRRMFVEAQPTLDNAYNSPNLELVFDGETGELKEARIIGSSNDE